jgi:hypothetical protein
MEFTKLVSALMEARRNAQLQGRPLSAQETEGITQGYFNEAGQRAAQNRQINTMEDRLAFERWNSQKMLEVANKSSNNELWNNLIKTGGSLAGMKYFGVI